MKIVSSPPPVEPHRRSQSLTRMKPMVPESLSNLLSGCGQIQHFSRLQKIVGDKPGAFLIEDGWAASAILKRNGELCMLSLYYPGDIMGLSNAVSDTCTEINFALSSTAALYLSNATIEAALLSKEHHKTFNFIMNHEREICIRRLVAASYGDAITRLAQFFMEIVYRTAALPKNNAISIHSPLRQTDIADFVSMTSVHVNRVLRSQRMLDIIELRSGLIRVKDLTQLSLLAGRIREIANREDLGANVTSLFH